MICSVEFPIAEPQQSHSTPQLQSLIPRAPLSIPRSFRSLHSFAILCRSLPSVPSPFLLVFLFIYLSFTLYYYISLYLFIPRDTLHILDRPHERRDDTAETVSSATLDRDTHSTFPPTVTCSWSYQSRVVWRQNSTKIKHFFTTLALFLSNFCDLQQRRWWASRVQWSPS